MKTFLTLLAFLLTFISSIAQEKAITGRIAASDTVSVTVFREADLNSSGQLGREGTLSIPLIGDVRMVGLTTTQAEKAIEAKFRDGYLVRPQVSVRITGRVVRTISVQGEVRQAGVFTLPYDRLLRLSEAIAMAGGATDIADIKKVKLKRALTGKVETVNLKDILNGRAKDITLSSGDTINVPEGWF